MAKRMVHMKAPSKDISVVSIAGAEYDVKKGFVSVSPSHVEHLQGHPHNFVVCDQPDDHEAEDDAAEFDFDRMSKAELIDFIRERGEQADRKMSKEQLVDLADSVKAKDAADEKE